jgi:ribosomal protein S18 acetylase RimI-like enzyme
LEVLTVRPAGSADEDAIWDIVHPMIAEGETYALPRDWGRAEVLSYWFDSAHQVFAAERDSTVVGTYYLRANHMGGGSHVANCGYVTSAVARGQGIARAMCLHSLAEAKRQRFLAMQFNFVVSSNRAALSLWERLSFEIVGVIPRGFHHPRLGFVDALVMHRFLEPGADPR